MTLKMVRLIIQIKKKEYKNRISENKNKIRKMPDSFSVKLYKKCINTLKDIIFRDKISKKEETIELNKNRFNINGYNIYGYNRYGYNINGLNMYGVNKDGLNINGLIGTVINEDEDHIYKIALDDNLYDQYGFNEDGFNKDRFNIYGFNKDGFNKDGYNKYGFDAEGYNKDGVDEYVQKRKLSGKGLTITALPMLLSELITNSSKKLIHDIEQLVKYLYNKTQIIKQVYNNLIKTITYKNGSQKAN